MNKFCPKCGTTKPTSEFHKDHTAKDGLARACKVCRCESSRLHREFGRKQNQVRRERDAERLAKGYKLCRKCCEIKPLSNFGRSRQYKDGFASQCKRCLAPVRASAKRRTRERMRQDPMKYLQHRISCSIRKSVKGNKGGRKWEGVVGYTFQQLRSRLMKTMPDGYTWDDYLSGQLHLDHIRPVASFDLSSVDSFDFKRCWALDNLQLLPASENIRKSDSLVSPASISLPGLTV